MIKAGALYFSIVISFMIAVISASVIMLAVHYRSSYLKSIRYNRLLVNLESARMMVLADEKLEGLKAFDLFGEGSDSVAVSKRNWGIYKVAWAKSFILSDTLSDAFLIGKADTLDRVSLYLSDEDRPLSVSEGTRIRGNALLPKSGIKSSYVDGKPYTGDKLVYGIIGESQRTLPELDGDLIKGLSHYLDESLEELRWFKGQALTVSFMQPVAVLRLKPNTRLSGTVSGNVILRSDTSVVITADAKLDGIQVYAPYIRVEDNFKGNCQLFARDSISVGQGVSFDYPSCLGLIRTTLSGDSPEIKAGDNLRFSGLMFSYESKRSPFQTRIGFGKHTRISGEVYAAGVVKFEKGMILKGKVSCNRFHMQTPQTLYENVLVDVQLNRQARSKYYLSTGLIKALKGESKVMKWLD
ncbi:hypothetical protein QWY86_15490 [Pedobacter aquatilis]|uniref:hypothetical protein n=1 Tax=Pedobacter aquatilis TaxID=351343 RepID=UPI0025B4534E|nr:hypothetical protein [Pedobacter aquatilis]MDN3588086.1 hypothetical protein [Pedobacter aquatilis]